MRRNTSNSSVVSYLIMASESGEVIILDTQSFAVLQHVCSIFLLLLECCIDKYEMWKFQIIGANCIIHINAKFDIS